MNQIIATKFNQHRCFRSYEGVIFGYESRPAQSAEPVLAFSISIYSHFSILAAI